MDGWCKICNFFWKCWKRMHENEWINDARFAISFGNVCKESVNKNEWMDDAGFVISVGNVWKKYAWEWMNEWWNICNFLWRRKNYEIVLEILERKHVKENEWLDNARFAISVILIAYTS